VRIDNYPEALQDQFALWVLQNSDKKSCIEEYKIFLRILIRHQSFDLLPKLKRLSFAKKLDLNPLEYFAAGSCSCRYFANNNLPYENCIGLHTYNHQDLSHEWKDIRGVECVFCHAQYQIVVQGVDRGPDIISWKSLAPA